MKNKTITFKEYNNRINQYNHSIRKGLKPIYKKNWFKIGLGCSIIGVSLITPFTNAFLIPIGLLILGVGLKEFEEYKRKIKNKFKQLINTKRGGY